MRREVGKEAGYEKRVSNGEKQTSDDSGFRDSLLASRSASFAPQAVLLQCTNTRFSLLTAFHSHPLRLKNQYGVRPDRNISPIAMG